LDRIAYIEKCKEEGSSLEDIKKKVINRFSQEVDVLDLRLRMQGLEKEVADVLSQLDQADPEKLNEYKKNLSPQSLSLIQALLLLLN